MAKRITSKRGEEDSKDEWSKGKSSASMQVTSPLEKFEPYLPALPKTSNSICHEMH